MKRIIYFLAVLLTTSYTVSASTNSSTTASATTYNYMRGYGNSFIFMESGIEFSVFADGQFDFYMPQYGPNVNVGYNSPGFSISFNSGYNYNPYVQYDQFGAIIQIENTPIFYDYFGRVNQIGNIFINYNGFGRINRIGGLNVYYRNNVFWRYDGFINSFNRRYIYRPWHSFYAVPPVNLCIVNTRPYRQFYTPIRHIYYRPYRNNVRHYNLNYGRRGNTNTVNSRRYAQTPRNNRERTIRREATRRNATINDTRATRLRQARVASTSPRANSDVNRRSVTTTRTRSNNNNDRTVTTTRRQTTTRATTPNRVRSSNASNRTVTNRNNNVTRSRSTVSNRTTRQSNSNVRQSRATTSRATTRSSSQNNRRSSTIQNKRKSSNNTSTRSNSRRSRS